MVPILLAIGATVIRTAAPSIIKALTKQGAKKIAKPTASQLKKAVSPNKAPDKIQKIFKEPSKKITAQTSGGGRGGVKPRIKKETPKEAPKTVKAKTSGGGRGGVTSTVKKSPAKKPDAKKPTTTKKPDDKKPTTTKKPDSKKDSGMSTGAKIIGGGALATALGAETIRQANKNKKEGMGGKATVSPNQKSRQGTLPRDSKTDSATVGKEQKSRQATLPKDEGMGGKATVSPNQKSRQATLPKEEGIGTKIARALGDKRSEEEMIRTRKMNEENEEEMNFRKGGAVKKKYGMREGGFTKRGGMYKKGY
jgi:hypothetical protein